MKKYTRFSILILLAALSYSCDPGSANEAKTVKTNDELNQSLLSAKPGDEIVMANGTWTDLQIVFKGEGTESSPITLRAETPGEVFIEGQSDLKFGGQYLVVSGLYFRNGYTPSRAVIEFRLNKDTLANHCRVTNTVIEGFNQPKRDKDDLWVQFWGRHNQLDHCYIAGKSNRGPTVRVSIEGNESIYNYHQITNNHFGPRPRKGGPSGETIQLGNSFTSMSPSYTMVANNLFEECNGEVEVISSKTNFNEFRNNVFYKSEGSLVMRHGNYCIVDGNYFIGADDSDNIGGIRIINTGHQVTNNYFFNLRGQSFRSPLAVMNGIPKSPLNRYNQVTDLVVAFNTWVNCASPLQFGVGTNISQKDVLPLSEIRSARPVRTLVANNVIYDEEADQSPVVAHDQIDGVSFKNNIINKVGEKFEPINGLETYSFEVEPISEDIYVPKNDLTSVEIYPGFEFEKVDKDLFGNARTPVNTVGAIVKPVDLGSGILDKKKYGTSWYSNEIEESNSKRTIISAEDNDLDAKINEANWGDIVVLKPGKYQLNASLNIDKLITIESEDLNNKAQIIYSGEAATPAFQLHPKAMLKLNGVELVGTKTQYAFASLKEGMSTLYSLEVEACEISNFNYILKAYKESMADLISFLNTVFRDSENGIELSEETNDKGDYNVEFLTVDGCEFNNISSNVIDYYRGGYDESTIGGNLFVTNSSFSNCGGKEQNGILLNTRGIINVDISNNSFKDNPVKLVALLWGAKNNTHSQNTIVNSGEIIVEENIKLNLMY